MQHVRTLTRYGNRFQNEIADVYYKWTFFATAAQWEATQWKARTIDAETGIRQGKTEIVLPAQA
jgi:hypothetical protein